MKKDSIFFATDSTRLFLPWMSMLMTFIAVLILATGITSYQAITNWKQVVSGALTVQIPTYTESGESRGQAVNQDVETALTILRSSIGVVGATVISDAQMTELMAPWLGGDVAVSELPLPKLIDVTLDSANHPNLAQIKTDLAEQVPSAILDSHRMRLEPLIKLSDAGIKLIIFILILLAVTASFTVVYATRTSLSAHEHVISLIHMMGANDWFLTQKYAVRHFSLTIMGGFFGFLLALPIMAGISFLIRGATIDFIWNPALGIGGWLTLLLVPVILSILAFLTTIKTVLGYLKRFL
ncbi:MAG: hypothetical protein IJV07_00610 [Alphaproteobacteria bacterium]|nr:hypothetical protein [Alphaproteobacteria bacterium]